MKTRPINRAKGRPAKLPASVALAHEVLEALRDELKLDGDDQPFLQTPEEQLYVYNGRHWQKVFDGGAKHIIYSRMERPERSTDRLRSEALREIRTICHRPAHRWGRVKDHEVPVENGVVDVRTMKLRPHRASDFIEAVIPHAFRPHARHATLDAYLASCFGDGEDQRIAALQAFAGYVVLPHARLKKAAVLYGPGDTGKSAFVEMMRALVGEEFCATLSVEDMEDPIKRHVLVGKKLNTLTELPSDAIVRDGGFKTLVGTEEPVLINPKYGHAFTYVSQAKHLIATNTLPRVNDRTDATLNRLYIVPFNRVIPAAERDRALQSRFLDEMSGILWWALQGAQRLMRAGEFPSVDLAKQRIDEMREEANPVAAFVRQMMIAEVGAVVPINEVTRHFNAWAGGGRKADIRAVGRMLRAAFGEESVRKAWNPGVRSTAQSFVGWRMRTADELALAEGRADWEADPPEP